MIRKSMRLKQTGLIDKYIKPDVIKTHSGHYYYRHLAFFL